MVVVQLDWSFVGLLGVWGKGLRVVDGSTLVESPGTNPMASLLMLGRYQGIKMLREEKMPVCSTEKGTYSKS